MVIGKKHVNQIARKILIYRKMLKLDTKPGIIFSGIVSIGFTIAYLAVSEDYIYSYTYSYNDDKIDIWRHISCLQLLSSVALIFGVFKQNFKLFVPWMISTALFIYMMTYLTIVLLTRTSINWIFIPPIMVAVTVYLTCALIAVNQAFDMMRKDQPESKINILTPL